MLVSKTRGGWVAGLSPFNVIIFFHWIRWQIFRKNSIVTLENGIGRGVGDWFLSVTIDQHYMTLMLAADAWRSVCLRPNRPDVRSVVRNVKLGSRIEVITCSGYWWSYPLMFASAIKNIENERQLCNGCEFYDRGNTSTYLCLQHFNGKLVIV